MLRDFGANPFIKICSTSLPPPSALFTLSLTLQPSNKTVFFLHFHRKRRKKIQVRIIETRHAADSSSDSDEDSPPPPPPPGSPKLYQTAEFVAKFACKAELKLAS